MCLLYFRKRTLNLTNLSPANLNGVFDYKIVYNYIINDINKQIRIRDIKSAPPSKNLLNKVVPINPVIIAIILSILSFILYLCVKLTLQIYKNNVKLA